MGDEETGLRASPAWKANGARELGSIGPFADRLVDLDSPAAATNSALVAIPGPDVSTAAPGALDMEEPPGLPPEEREYRSW